MEWIWVVLTNPLLFMCHGCRVGMTFESTTVNDNVTGCNAPVTLGSAQWGQWSIEHTGGCFGPPTPTFPSTTPYFPIPTLFQWLDQPSSSPHMAPHSVRQPLRHHPVIFYTICFFFILDDFQCHHLKCWYKYTKAIFQSLLKNFFPRDLPEAGLLHDDYV